MNPYTSYLEQAFGRGDVTGPKMQAAIREWFDLYFGRAFPGEDPADRLPVLIVSKLCRAVFAEYESRLAPGGAKTGWMAGNLRALDAVKGRAMQAALVGGECLLKPVPAGKGFAFVPVRRDCFAPLGRDAEGRLQAVGTMELLSGAGRHYMLLERRSAGADGLTIETRLFELAGGRLGREAPLAALPATADLRPTLLLPGVPGWGWQACAPRCSTVWTAGPRRLAFLRRRRGFCTGWDAPNTSCGGSLKTALRGCLPQRIFCGVTPAAGPITGTTSLSACPTTRRTLA